MASPLPHPDEPSRLAELASYQIMDSGPEAAFDAITHAATLVAGVPVAAVGLIDATREWFKAAVGLDVSEVAREETICDQVVRDGSPLLLNDASVDERFARLAAVRAEGGVRFYAGFPLTSPTGAVLGSLCVTDSTPRTLSSEQVQILWTLADQVMAQLELRRQAQEALAARDVAQQRQILLDAVLDSVDVGILVCDADGVLVSDNAFNRALTGVSVTADQQAQERVALIGMTDARGHPLSADDHPLARCLAGSGNTHAELVLHPPGLPARQVRALGRALRSADDRMLGAMVAMHDVTAIRDREAELSARVRDVERLAEASRKIVAGEDAAAVACDAVQAITRAQQVCVLLPDGQGNLVVTASTEPALDTFVVPLAEESIVGAAYRTGEPILVDPHADGRGYSEAIRVIEQVHGTIRSAIYQPLLHGSGCNGVLLLTTSEPLSAVPSRIFGLLDVVTAELSTSLERDRLRRELAAQASTDPLTGLANRRAWDEQVAAQLAVSGATGLCLAILDLDHFKLFNDTFGHQAGDRLLVAAAEAWGGGVRSNDLLARLGGEEFGVLLPGCQLSDARVVLDGLRRIVPEGQTVSVGVAQWRADETVSTWYARADRALYRAKAAGRDRVEADTDPFSERRLAGVPAQFEAGPEVVPDQVPAGADA